LDYFKIKEALKRELLQKKGLFDWEKIARPCQKIPQGEWRIWLILAGRGFGKTRTGAETVRQWASKGEYKRICLLGHHLDDVRRVMIEGESGLLSVCPSYERPLYEPSKKQLTWPCGSMAFAYSGQEYNQLRGPQFDAAWVDELAKFSYPEEALDQLMLGLRLGSIPRVIITTTPRPLPIFHSLLGRTDIVVTRGSTFDNKENLPTAYIENIENTYGKTWLGAQEIEGKLVDTPKEKGLWCPQLIQRSPFPSQFERIIVSIDPAVTQKETSDETGMIVVGIDPQKKGYVLEDLSGSFSPSQWIERAVHAYEKYKADRIIAEVNNGGDLVQHLLHSLFPHVSYRGVHATRSKMIRAEPIAALYEQKKIFHCGYFQHLEEQMIYPKSFKSPDRLDALVWGLTELFISPSRPPKIMRF
jgi:phage terminase large subunit-like protein